MIDVATGTLYAVFSTRNCQPLGCDGGAELPSLDVAFWLVALDIHDGHVLRHAKLAGSVKRSDGSTLAFLARNHYNAPGLLLSRGSIYIAFGMRFKEEWIEYHGWVLRYDAADFAQQGAFCSTRDSVGPSTVAGNGGGIWGGGGGLAAVSDGNVYVQTGNAWSDPANGWYGDALIKLTPSGNSLDYVGSFSPSDPLKNLKINDVDLGSGGAMVIPGTDRVVGGGKTGILYLLDRGTMLEKQEFQAFINTYDPTTPVDANWFHGPHMHGSPSWWKGADPGRRG